MTSDIPEMGNDTLQGTNEHGVCADCTHSDEAVKQTDASFPGCEPARLVSPRKHSIEAGKKNQPPHRGGGGRGTGCVCCGLATGRSDLGHVSAAFWKCLRVSVQSDAGQR